MRDYGKVHSTFWSSPTTSSMTDDGKVLALYLLTCSHSTIAGVFRLPDGYVSEDLGWPLERVAQGFAELFDKGFANRCATTKWVWISKHLEWNKPENPNQRKSAAKIALSVPDECGWKLDFMRVCGPLLEIEAPQISNPSETVSQPFLNQEQKQEQKQKQKQEQELVEAPSAKSPRKRSTTSEASRPDDVSEKVWADFLAVRKVKRAPLTDTALEGIAREAATAGISLNDAIAYCCSAGWQGFNAGWYANREGSKSGPQRGLPINKQEALEQRNRSVAASWAAQGGNHAAA